MPPPRAFSRVLWRYNRYLGLKYGGDAQGRAGEGGERERSSLQSEREREREAERGRKHRRERLEILEPTSQALSSSRQATLGRVGGGR